jgi:hypothetical protein
MTYEEFKQLKAIQDKRTDKASDLIGSFDKLPNGLTPDHIKQSEQWKTAYRNFNHEFRKTRELNQLGNKLFKKEIRKEHMDRRMNKSVKNDNP